MAFALRTSFLLFVPLLTLAAGCSAALGGGESVGQTNQALDQEALASVKHFSFKDRCEAGRVGARCFAKVRTDESGNVATTTAPQGFSPSDLRSAYAIPTSTATFTIALVDAQDNPNVESDLAKYRAEYGLPPCTSANGCFKKVNQDGVVGSYPSPDPDWAGEIILDVSMASAACPTCKILLVEANSQAVADLGAAVNTAVTLGASVVSNSYGWPEDSTDPASDSAYYHHKGVAIFASTGDDGYGVEYPAAGYYVLSVGGTTLATSTSTRGWAEEAWSGGGSGCSHITSEPPWQHHAGCAHKMTADLSAVADPDTGVAVYDSYGAGGWTVYGGTSVASPLVAGIFAATGHVHADGATIWKNETEDYYDITQGSNGSCVTSLFCNAEVGYDGPTGWGTPNGAGLYSWGSFATAQ